MSNNDFYIIHASAARENVDKHGKKLSSLSNLISSRIIDASQDGKSSVSVNELFDIGKGGVDVFHDILCDKGYTVEVYYGENDHDNPAAGENTFIISW